MKSIGSYILLSFLSLFFVVQIALFLVAVKPDLFISSSGLRGVDSVATTLAVQADSMNVEGADTVAQQTKTETQLITQKIDSSSVQKTQLDSLQKRNEDMNQKIADAAKISDSTKAEDNKGRVKLLESMSIENAARIIQQMETEEARTILKIMKKRQAAKILSSLEPEKAIELMR